MLWTFGGANRTQSRGRPESGGRLARKWSPSIMGKIERYIFLSISPVYWLACLGVFRFY